MEKRRKKKSEAKPTILGPDEAQQASQPLNGSCMQKNSGN